MKEIYFTPENIIKYIEAQQAGEIIDPVCVDRNFLVGACKIIMGLPPYGMME
jgi:hypothetical protein